MALASLDTNVVLRLVMADVPDLHQRARDLVASPGARFEVSDYVFVELVFVLDRHYGLDRQQISATVEGLLELDNLDCHESLLRAALDQWRTHPSLSFEDCLMAEHALSRGATPLWTFDHKLALQHDAVREVPAHLTDRD